MTLVLQPRSSSRDLVGGALATDTDQATEILELEGLLGVGELLGGEVRVEGSEELETGGSGGDGELSLGDGLGESGRKVGRVTCQAKGVSEGVRSDAGRRTSSEANGGELVTSRRLKAEGLAIGTDELILGGVEAELAREGLRIRKRSVREPRDESRALTIAVTISGEARKFIV